MKVRVIEKHLGEGVFPTFEKGTRVAIKGNCTHFLHWFACEIAGYETYVPESFVCGGVLTREYNPTELVQNAGDLLDVLEIVNSWLIAKNESGQSGWIPAESVVSVNGYCE